MLENERNMKEAREYLVVVGIYQRREFSNVSSTSNVNKKQSIAKIQKENLT